MKTNFRYVLHIGRHKTGTSSLQRFLAENREVLSERHGMVYPPSFFGPGHHHLAFHLKPSLADPVHATRFDDGEAATERYLRDVQTSPGTVRLISSEAFQNLEPSVAAQMFPPGLTRVIFYVREPLDYLLSSYCQKVHAQQSIETLSEYSVRFGVDYQGFAAKWSEVFGRENVTICLFEKKNLEGQDIRRDFLIRLGFDPTGFQFAAARENPSIGGRLIDVKLALNALPMDPVELRRRTYQSFGDLARSYREFRFRPVMPEELARAFLERNAVSMREFVATHLPALGEFSGRLRRGQEPETTWETDAERIRAYFAEEDPQWLDEVLEGVLNRLGERWTGDSAAAV